MLHTFLADRFHYQHQQQLQLITHLLEEKELSFKLRKAVSYLLNDAHIAFCNWQEIEAESELSDLQAEKDWIVLEKGNFQTGFALFEEAVLETKSNILNAQFYQKIFEIIALNYKNQGVILRICEENEIDLPKNNLTLLR